MGLLDNDDNKAALPPGSLINNRYQIERALGSGGMGSVYLATDQVLNGEKVAIKVLHTDLLADERQMQRFLREVQLMRRINQRNVVRTFDVGSDGDLVYFTMEYIPGRPLEDYAEKGDYPLKSIASLIIQICEGLEAIHRAGVIHRDMKPANIIVVENDIAKITDFGVARPEYSELTAHNEIVGSALYIAPEVWLGTKMTPSVDLYSLGVILYEITTGVLPFAGDSPAALMRMHLEYLPPEPKTINQAIPSWLNKLTLRLLAKSPLDRPKDAREVVEFVTLHTGQVKAKFVQTVQERENDPARFMEKLEAMTAKSVFAEEQAGKTSSDSSSRKSRLSAGLEPKESLRRSLLYRLILTTVMTVICVGGERLIAGLRMLFEPEILQQSLEQFGLRIAQGGELPSSGLLFITGLCHGVQAILRASFPLVLIGAVAGNARVLSRFFVRAFVLCSALWFVFFAGYALSSSFDQGVKSLSLHTAARSAAIELIQCAFLDPFMTIFRPTLVEQGLLLSANESLPIFQTLKGAVGVLLFLIFIALFVRRVFEPLLLNAGRVGFGLAAIGFVATIAAPYFLHTPKVLIADLHSPAVSLVVWSIVLLVSFFGTLILHRRHQS